MSDDLGGAHSPTEPGPVSDSVADEPYDGAPVMPHTGQPSTPSPDEYDAYAVQRAAEEAELAATNQPAAEPASEPVPVVE